MVPVGFRLGVDVAAGFDEASTSQECSRSVGVNSNNRFAVAESWRNSRQWVASSGGDDLQDNSADSLEVVPRMNAATGTMELVRGA
jgi:hypothetical protein